MHKLLTEAIKIIVSGLLTKYKLLKIYLELTALEFVVAVFSPIDFFE